MTDQSEQATSPADGGPPPGSGDADGRPTATAATATEILVELRALRREVASLRHEVRTGFRRPGTPFEHAARARPSRLRIGRPRLREGVGQGLGQGVGQGLGRAAGGVRARLGGIQVAVARLHAGGEWAPSRPLLWDVAAVVVIGLVAWLLRGVDLSGIPRGLHGDEAATGLEARRILDEGWIGVYTGAAGGNPTGAYYLAAPLLRVVDDPVVAVRLLSAVAGTLGVLALYVLARRNLGFGSAVVAASTLAVSEWHLQFSRTGFVTGTWPTIVLLGAIALMEAIRTRRWGWWVAAGAVLASGVYVYNGHAPFMLVLAVFVAGALLGWRGVAVAACLVALRAPWPLAVGASVAAAALLSTSRRLRERVTLVDAAAFAGASLLVLRGMIDFARAHHQDYFGRSEQLSVFRSDAWRARTGLVDQAAFLLGRYRDFWDQLAFHPRTNGVDLSGITPPVPEITLLICLAGLIIALVRRPNPLVVLAALVVAAAPMTAVATDMTLRRSLVIAPFLALLGAVGVVEVARLASRRGRLPAIAAGLALAGLLAASGERNLDDFFGKTVDAGPVRHDFAAELREAADYMDALPPDAYVYLDTDRWVIDNEVIRLIAPDVRGENRSTVWGGTGTYEVDRAKGAPVFVLLGDSTEKLPELQALYPGGRVVVGETPLPPPLVGPAFVAYELPPAP